MDVSSKTLIRRVRSRKSGFSLVELLVSMFLAFMMFAVIVMLYQAGIWEYRHASGRIELVRKARALLGRVQPLLSTAVKPVSAGAQEAIAFPDTFTDDLHQTGESRVAFYTPLDALVTDTLPSARELQANANYHLYEIAMIPGASGNGNDVVLRKLIDPITPDMGVTPRILTTGIDDFRVRYLRPGAVEIQVTVSGARITDEIVRNTTEDRTPLNLVMNTIIQLPYYNK